MPAGFQPRLGSGQSGAGRALGPSVPEDELQFLDFGAQAGGLWQSEAFQEDLQVPRRLFCRVIFVT